MANPGEETIEAYLVDEGSHCIRFVPTSAIAYFFIATAFEFINASWTGELTLRDRAVYIRTRAGQTFRAIGFRSLTQVRDDIDSKNFLKVHRSILLNVCCVGHVNPRGKRKEVGLRLQRESHTIFVSRVGLKELRKKLKACGGGRTSPSRPTRRGRAPRSRVSSSAS